MLNVFTDIDYFIAKTVKSENSSDKKSTVKQISPVTGLEGPRGFQEVMVPRFHDNGTGRW